MAVGVPQYLLNRRLTHGAGPDLRVHVEEGEQVACPPVQQLVGEVRVSADSGPLELQKSAQENACFPRECLAHLPETVNNPALRNDLLLIFP